MASSSYYILLHVLYFLFLLGFQNGVSARGPCDPLVPQYCLLPFPNSFYTIQSTYTVTGLSVNLSHDISLSILNQKLDPSEWNTFDGFSVFPSILAYFPNLSSNNLPPHWDVERSLSLSDSPTLLLNLDTGDFVPHFAELDISAQSNLIPQKIHSLMIWPAYSLNYSSHYLVILRYLRSTDNKLIEPSYAFKALRDDIITNDTDIEYRRSDYNKLFELISNQYGILRNDIQLMWDFTTASQESLTGRLLHMRDDSFKRIEQNGWNYNILSHTDNFSQHIYRRIIADVQVPDYLNRLLPGGHLVINHLGLPVYQQMTPLTFRVLIPQSVANGTIKDPLLVQYGHGLFSDQSEVETEFLQEQANRYGYVLFACNLWGMANYDVPSLVVALVTNISNIRIIPDQLTQGVVNQLLLMRLMKGAFIKDPLMNINGRQLVVDGRDSYFYGISLGGIMGEVYMAVTNDVKRGVLGVPGGSFGLLLPRSIDFTKDFEFMRFIINDPVTFNIFVSLLNMIWSRAEPNGYMTRITHSTLPNTINHHVLYQYGLGDAQVNVLALYTIARSSKAKMFVSNVKQKYFPNPDSNVIINENLFGFEFESDDEVLKDVNVAVGFDCGAPPEPMGNIAPNAATDTHEKPRRAKYAQEQFDAFIRRGEIINFCKGPCTDCSEP